MDPDGYGDDVEGIKEINGGDGDVKMRMDVVELTVHTQTNYEHIRKL